MKTSPVLIVEDDIVIADFLEELLQDAGFDVCGIARNGAEAMVLAKRHRPGLAVVDMRLAHGEVGTSVAAMLCAQGEIGILYATGNARHPLLDHAVGQGCIAKPYTPESIIAGLRIVAERMAKCIGLSAFPAGFRLLNA
jgi:DNA-binding response OmpR family regulator